MKTIRLYLTLLLGCLLVAACESYLEEVSQNKLKPNTTDDYDQLLNKAYITEQIVPYLDILSDDVNLDPADHLMAGNDMGDIYISAYMWADEHEYSMPGGDIAFGKLYESIFYCNVVLENIDNASGMELDMEKVRRVRNNIKGEAYALRAWSYFYLVNLYGKWYDPATCMTDAGIPINLSMAAEDKAYTRNTVKEVYDRIVSDLQEAVRLMEANPISKTTKVKFNALSAKALLARVHLYMQNWKEAIACAEAVIQENPNIFNLHEAGERLNADNNTVSSWNKITVWGQDYLAKENENVLFVNGLSELVPALGWYHFISTFRVNKELQQCFDFDDVRRYYFMGTYILRGNPGLIYAKNRAIPMLSDVMEPRAGSKYTRTIRTEEMYLILAEAYAHSENGMEQAIGYLNRLRVEKFRAGQYTPLQSADFTQSGLLEEIAMERRKEFCFEGHRWFDLRRTTRPAMERTGYENQTARLEKDDPRYILQIPSRELSVNPAIGKNPR